MCDNGPEFVSQALDRWASQRGVTLDFIRAGEPVENCFIESFNGRLRDECSNVHHFRTLEEARTVIEAWRTEYNTERPHGSLGWQTPEGLAAQLGQDTAGTLSRLYDPEWTHDGGSVTFTGYARNMPAAE